MNWWNCYCFGKKLSEEQKESLLTGLREMICQRFEASPNGLMD